MLLINLLKLSSPGHDTATNWKHTARYFLEAPEGIWNELQMEEKDILQSAKWGVWDYKLLWKLHGLHYESFWLIFSICSYAVVIHDVSIKINTAMLESTRHMVKCGSSLFKSLVGVSERVIVCWLLLPLALLSIPRRASGLSSRSHVRTSQVFRLERKEQDGLGCGREALERTRRRCGHGWKSAVVNRLLLLFLWFRELPPNTAGPVVCLVGLFGCRCEALLPITMIPWVIRETTQSPLKKCLIWPGLSEKTCRGDV